jgi:hypothetical protein
MPVRDIYDLPPVPVEGQSPMEFFGVEQWQANTPAHPLLHRKNLYEDSPTKT